MLSLSRARALSLSPSFPPSLSLPLSLALTLSLFAVVRVKSILRRRRGTTQRRRRAYLGVDRPLAREDRLEVRDVRLARDRRDERRGRAPREQLNPTPGGTRPRHTRDRARNREVLQRRGDRTHRRSPSSKRKRRAPTPGAGTGAGANQSKPNQTKPHHTTQRTKQPARRDATRARARRGESRGARASTCSSRHGFEDDPTCSQSTPTKKGCCASSCTPVRAPSRRVGSLTSSRLVTRSG